MPYLYLWGRLHNRVEEALCRIEPVICDVYVRGAEIAEQGSPNLIRDSETPESPNPYRNYFNVR